VTGQRDPSHAFTDTPTYNNHVKVSGKSLEQLRKDGEHLAVISKQLREKAKRLRDEADESEAIAQEILDQMRIIGKKKPSK